MELVFLALIVLAATWFVTGPLRDRTPTDEDNANGEADARLADLEARKEAKYREIRDAQLDHAQGKLADDDFERLDFELRREAIEILRELDRVRDGA